MEILIEYLIENHTNQKNSGIVKLILDCVFIFFVYYLFLKND